MSHIDSGSLHAYLDGALDEFPVAEAEEIRAHLESCAECAQRLEAERRVRADAHSMLGMASPQVDLPSLEELRAYVKRTRPEPVSARHRMARMGWAASVVLALGAGWMLRGGQLQEAAVNQRDGFADAPAASGAAPGPSEESGRPGEAQALGRTAGVVDRMGAEGSASEGPATRATEATAAPRARADRVESETAPARQVATRAKAADTNLEEVQARDLPAAMVATAEIPKPSDLPADALRADEVGLRDAEDLLRSTAGRGAELVATAALAPASPLNAGAVDVGAVSTDAASLAAVGTDAEPAAEEDRRAERRLSESLVPVTSAMNQTGRGGVREVAQDDDRFSDEPLLGVPGFEVISVTSLGAGTKPLGVRVVQRLEEGAMLEVYHLEPGVDVATVPALPSDLNEVRVEAETGWVVVRGPRSEDELEVLLARLFPK